MKLIKLYNILFFNFRLIDYKFRKILLVYMNPICWIVESKKIKYGFKIYFDSLDTNFLPFLTLYKHDYLSKTSFSIFSTIIFWTLINYVLAFFSFHNNENLIQITGFLSLVISTVLNRIFLFKSQRFYDYHKDFIFNKKYNYPIIFFILIILIYVLLFYSIFALVK